VYLAEPAGKDRRQHTEDRSQESGGRRQEKVRCLAKNQKKRIQGFEDSRIQVVLLESFFKTKRGKESEKRLSLAESAENAEKDEIDLWPEF